MSEHRPEGELYDWYHRALGLLERGDAAAAAHLLEHAARDDPGSRSIIEALARARFDSGDYRGAAATFQMLVEVAPDDDYAWFGWGLANSRLGDFEAAAEHLRVAVTLRPGGAGYEAALRQVTATLRFRTPS
jgi:Flp pilus assembly protein TadD